MSEFNNSPQKDYFPQKYSDEVAFHKESPRKGDFVGQKELIKVEHTAQKEAAYQKLRASDPFMQKPVNSYSPSRSPRRGEFYERNQGTNSLLSHNADNVTEYSQHRKPSPFRGEGSYARLFTTKEEPAAFRTRGDVALAISTRGHMTLWTDDPSSKAAGASSTFNATAGSMGLSSPRKDLNSTGVADMVLTRTHNSSPIRQRPSALTSGGAQQTFYSGAPSGGSSLNHTAEVTFTNNAAGLSTVKGFVAGGDSPSVSSPRKQASPGASMSFNDTNTSVKFSSTLEGPSGNMDLSSTGHALKSALMAHNDSSPSRASPARHQLHGLSNAELQSLAAINEATFAAGSPSFVPGARKEASEFVSVTGNTKARTHGPPDALHSLSDFSFPAETSNRNPTATLPTKVYTHRGRRVVEESADHFDRPVRTSVSSSPIKEYREYPSRSFDSKLQASARGVAADVPSPPKTDMAAAGASQAKANYWNGQSVGHNILGQGTESLFNSPKHAALRGEDASVSPVVPSKLSVRRDFNPDTGRIVGQGAVGAGRNVQPPSFRSEDPSLKGAWKS